MSAKKLFLLCLPLMLTLACGLSHGVDLPQGSTEEHAGKKNDFDEGFDGAPPTMGSGEPSLGGACGTGSDDSGGAGGQSSTEDCGLEQ